MNFYQRFRDFLSSWLLSGHTELPRLRSRVAALEVENSRWKTTCRELGEALNRQTTENGKLTARLARQQQKLAEILGHYQAGLNAIKAGLETTEADSCKREETQEQGQKQNRRPQPPSSQRRQQGNPTTTLREQPTHREQEAWPLKKS